MVTWLGVPVGASAGAARTGGDDLRRRETLVGLARCIGALFVAVAILSRQIPGDGVRESAAFWHGLIAVLSALVTLLVARRLSDPQVAATAVLTTIADLVFLVLYQREFHDVQGAGTILALLVMLVVPLRWGWWGALVAGPTVLAISLRWPQLPDSGPTADPGTTIVLVVLIVLAAVGAHYVVERADRRSRMARSLFVAAFNDTSHGMLLLTADGSLYDVNAAGREILGPMPEPYGRLCDLLGAPTLETVVTEVLRSGTSRRLELLRGQRQLEISLSPLGDDAGQATVVAHVTDVTERHVVAGRLRQQAMTDPLTGLPNRSALMADLDLRLAAGEQPAVLFLDLDRFKAVNDSLGHDQGDRLLRVVADRLTASLRPGDVAARLGGDEFVVVAAGVGPCALAGLGERLHESLREPVLLDAGIVVTSASIGAALADPGATASSLLRQADTAMYVAKTRHLSVKLYDQADGEQVTRRHLLEVELRRALSDPAFPGLAVAYQPLVDLTASGEGRAGGEGGDGGDSRAVRAVGAEALARWHHPDLGPVEPSEFVRIAEDSDLIHTLGRWVLAEAVHATAALDDASTVSVNISQRQLLDPGLPAEVRRLLAESGLAPLRLCLEVSERDLVDLDRLVDALTALRRTGVRLSIDDFGTGGASLSYLARLPVHEVKIDRSFVAALGSTGGPAERRSAAAIVGGVARMAHALGLDVVAEGIETAGQLSEARELGCDVGQGFLLGFPVTAPVRALRRPGERLAVGPRAEPARPMVPR